MNTIENAFESLPYTPGNHFWLLSHAAILRLICYLRELAEALREPADSCFRRFPFLQGYFASIRSLLPNHTGWDDSITWWAEQLVLWEQEALGQCRVLPLYRLLVHSGLTDEDRLALLLVGLLEDDIQFGALYAALQEPLPTRRLSVGLLESLFGDPQMVERLRATGVLVLENQEAPHPEWVLRIPFPLWEALKGTHPEVLSPTVQFYKPTEFLPLKALVFPAELRSSLLRLPALLHSGELEGLFVRGTEGSGRGALLGALARSLRRGVLCATLGSQESNDPLIPLLGPLCFLTGDLPVLIAAPSPGEVWTLPELRGYTGPVGVLLPREGGVRGPLARNAVVLTLPAPALAERKQLWQATLPDAAAPLVAQAAAFRLPRASIATVARRARSYAQLEGHPELTADHVRRATQLLDREALDLLAQQIPLLKAPEAETLWHRLVVSEATRRELQELERRCRYREALLESLPPALAHTTSPGVRALLAGPSGTGKTLATRVLASILGRDLYRVDLAAIVSKYIGETEKNLSRLLDRAESLDVILLIDEGDSLLSGRTDIKSSNDRYANQETSYLLQRLEGHEGIVFVTTNALSRIDTAFERRFEVIVNFTLPEQDERVRLWELHLPPGHGIREVLLREVARHCALTGGQIRNAALHAALLALEANRPGCVEESDLFAAVEREYRKAGAICPLEAPSTLLHDPVQAFLKEAL